MAEDQPGYMPDGDERTLAILSHILAIIPGVGFLAPLVIYLLKKNDSAFVAANAKESLNFQLTIILLYIILFITLIGVLLFWVVGILNTVLVIVATIRAAENRIYRYPISIRLIR
ncbi:DUF4870 domain-containing protein [Flavitalea sp. BT771]|uniref:DUF4870 domain-containing protein n=1 Tax=Flavitalea sp. BT771 TaxID=3063329 RepID=UPI0026E14FB1|nr:DUF4870 domain-containing protein [Flavitalea sp. BT771]MDO6433930.1 DUF4870 domain-containing protein [Flavitalea sp. BT771]MDV6222165.1 DUF4870 domain-containing protein [Flavitalea sp. BT771]